MHIDAKWVEHSHVYSCKMGKRVKLCSNHSEETQFINKEAKMWCHAHNISCTKCMIKDHTILANNVEYSDKISTWEKMLKIWHSKEEKTEKKGSNIAHKVMERNPV